jgi:hypothetical protein
MHDIVRSDADVTDISPRGHGVAWSLYFGDPVENVVETFVPTPGMCRHRPWCPTTSP